MSRAGGVRGAPLASVRETVGETRGVGESAGGGGEVGCLMSLRRPLRRDFLLFKRQTTRTTTAARMATDKMAMAILTPRGSPVSSSLSCSLFEGSEVVINEGSLLLEYVVSGIKLCTGAGVEVSEAVDLFDVASSDACA